MKEDLLEVVKQLSQSVISFAQNAEYVSPNLWHIHSLLGNDLETKNETTAVARQWSTDYNKGIVFYATR
jgi:pyridoxal/pyridoxine/pyridoxamine kinase